MTVGTNGIGVKKASWLTLAAFSLFRISQCRPDWLSLSNNSVLILFEQQALNFDLHLGILRISPPILQILWILNSNPLEQRGPSMSIILPPSGQSWSLKTSRNEGNPPLWQHWTEVMRSRHDMRSTTKSNYGEAMSSNCWLAALPNQNFQSDVVNCEAPRLLPCKMLVRLEIPTVPTVILWFPTVIWQCAAAILQFPIVIFPKSLYIHSTLRTPKAPYYLKWFW